MGRPFLEINYKLSYHTIYLNVLLWIENYKENLYLIFQFDLMTISRDINFKMNYQFNCQDHFKF